MTKRTKQRVARKLFLPLVALAMMTTAMAIGSITKPSPASINARR